MEHNICWYSTQGDFICPRSRVHNLKPQYVQVREDFSANTRVRPAYINDQTKLSACRERLSHGSILPATEAEHKGYPQQAQSGLQEY